MSGKGNHQYGKLKTERMINSVKASNSKKIIVEGKNYNSITEFSKVSGIGLTTIDLILLTLTIDIQKKKYNKVQKKEKKIHNKCVPVYVDGVRYISYKEASKALGIPAWTVSRRAKSDKYPNYHN